MSCRCVVCLGVCSSFYGPQMHTQSIRILRPYGARNLCQSSCRRNRRGRARTRAALSGARMKWCRAGSELPTPRTSRRSEFGAPPRSRCRELLAVLLPLSAGPCLATRREVLHYHHRRGILPLRWSTRHARPGCLGCPSTCGHRESGSALNGVLPYVHSHPRCSERDCAWGLPPRWAGTTATTHSIPAYRLQRVPRLHQRRGTAPRRCHRHIGPSRRPTTAPRGIPPVRCLSLTLSLAVCL